MAYIALFAAALCAVLRCSLGKYIFSALATLLCALAVSASGGVPFKVPLIAGLLVSIVADWCLAHQKAGENMFLYGVAGFFAAHCLFAWYAVERFSYNLPALVVALTLLAGYAVYLFVRLMPRVDAGLKIPVFLYMVASIASFYLAMSMSAPPWERVLYVAGIAAILASDTMIGESDFGGNKAADKLLLPAYYLCHVLISLSAVIR
jgi:hypothetical protein